MLKDAVRDGCMVLAAKLNDVCHCRKGSAVQSKRSGGMELWRQQVRLHMGVWSTEGPNRQ